MDSTPGFVNLLNSQCSFDLDSPEPACGKEEELSQIHAMLEIKEKLSKQKMLECLLGKKEPLSEMETSLKLKLMSEML
ncbi:hypothetical protein Bca52824_054607 [Brassica carinata]|uniref:Uncharacterized protein n=1 Tax=Brassica carinata TaxID=52824 RepID=A0A8X7R866_BRACI|nr:hypothetical protein Bca52824_054607 [Brassica carinata]